MGSGALARMWPTALLEKLNSHHTEKIKLTLGKILITHDNQSTNERNDTVAATMSLYSFIQNICTLLSFQSNLGMHAAQTLTLGTMFTTNTHETTWMNEWNDTMATLVSFHSFIQEIRTLPVFQLSEHAMSPKLLHLATCLSQTSKDWSWTLEDRNTKTALTLTVLQPTSVVYRPCTSLFSTRWFFIITVDIIFIWTHKEMCNHVNSISSDLEAFSLYWAGDSFAALTCRLAALPSIWPSCSSRTKLDYCDVIYSSVG